MDPVRLRVRAVPRAGMDSIGVQRMRSPRRGFAARPVHNSDTEADTAKGGTIMGERGPLPKRDEARAGHRSKAERADKVVPTRNAVVDAPAPSREWCNEARAWYLSLAESGESFYFEPSDWQYAFTLAAMLSRLLTSARPSAQLAKVVFDAMESLGTTEGARRRMRIEVDRERKPATGDPDATVTATGDVAARFQALRAVEGGK